MAKRFTDTEIWDKEWFMDLPAVKKCLVRYIFDKCDVAGIWSPNWKLASMYIGEAVTESDLLSIGQDLFVKMDSGKIFVSKFCTFQYGTLSESCAPHKKVIQILNSNSIDHTNPEGYSKGIITLQEKEKEMDIDMDKEKEPEKEKQKGGMGEKQKPIHPGVVEVIKYLNELNGTNFRTDTKATVKLIEQRFAEGFPISELKEIIEYKVAEWKGTPQDKWLQPDTLFNGENCAKYRNQVQAAKDKNLSISQIRARPSNAPKSREEMMEEFRIAQAKKYAQA